MMLNKINCIEKNIVLFTNFYIFAKVYYINLLFMQ
jgi:hypothetical protein